MKKGKSLKTDRNFAAASKSFRKSNCIRAKFRSCVNILKTLTRSAERIRISETGRNIPDPEEPKIKAQHHVSLLQRGFTLSPLLSSGLHPPPSDERESLQQSRQWGELTSVHLIPPKHAVAAAAVARRGLLTCAHVCWVRRPSCDTACLCER